MRTEQPPGRPPAPADHQQPRPGHRRHHHGQGSPAGGAAGGVPVRNLPQRGPLPGAENPGEEAPPVRGPHRRPPEGRGNPGPAGVLRRGVRADRLYPGAEGQKRPGEPGPPGERPGIEVQHPGLPGTPAGGRHPFGLFERDCPVHGPGLPGGKRRLRYHDDDSRRQGPGVPPGLRGGPGGGNLPGELRPV